MTANLLLPVRSLSASTLIGWCQEVLVSFLRFSLDTLSCNCKALRVGSMFTFCTTYCSVCSWSPSQPSARWEPSCLGGPAFHTWKSAARDWHRYKILPLVSRWDQLNDAHLQGPDEASLPERLHPHLALTPHVHKHPDWGPPSWAPALRCLCALHVWHTAQHTAGVASLLLLNE